MTIQDYVLAHTQRGECRCGRCIDKGTAPDPTGHTADMVFFKVSARDEPTADEFRRLTAEHPGDYGPVNPLDGHVHSYLELGGWIGDQGMALQYMALGSLLGVFKLLTPMTMLPGPMLTETLALRMAETGYVAVQAA